MQRLDQLPPIDLAGKVGVKDFSAGWLKASKALKKEDRIYGQRLAESSLIFSASPWGCDLV